MLLCGGQCNDENGYGFVLVLDSDTLTCQHTQLLNHEVYSLLGVLGEVWGTIEGPKGIFVVLWGKAEWGQGSGMSKAGRA